MPQARSIASTRCSCLNQGTKRLIHSTSGRPRRANSRLRSAGDRSPRTSSQGRTNCEERCGVPCRLHLAEVIACSNIKTSSMRWI